MQNTISGSVKCTFAAALLSFSILVPCSVSFGEDHDGLSTGVGPKWDPWASVGGYAGSDDNGRAEFGLFAPLIQDNDSLWFTDIRGKIFGDQVLEGNVAIGYRQMMQSGFNLGGWVGLDMRQSESENQFSQISAGLEALSERFDLRANAYLPISDPEMADPGLADVSLSGASIAMVGGEEVPLYGADGEVGVHVPFEIAGGAAQLSLYGGAFYFDDDEAEEAITGPKARVELALNDSIFGPGSKVTAGYEFSDDSVRGDRHSAGLKLRFALAGSFDNEPQLSAQERRMADGLERDVDIVVGQSKSEQVMDAHTEVRFDQVAQATDSGSLDTAIGTGGNTLIILDGTENPSIGAKTLADNQTLLGGGGMLKVRGVNSGAVSYFTASGNRPTLADENTVLTMANNSHAAGLMINKTNAGTTAIGIDANGMNNVALSYNIIDTVGTNSHAAQFNSGERFQFWDNQVMTSGENALGLFVNNALDINIDSNMITTSGEMAEAMAIWEDVHMVYVTNNTLRATSIGSQAHGLIVGDSSSDLHIKNNDVETAGYQSGGIVFLSGISDVWAVGNMVRTTGDQGQGFYFQNDNDNVNLSGNDVKTAGHAAQAMYAGSRNSNFTIDNNQFVTTSTDTSGGTTEAHGIEFSGNAGANTNIQITNNFIKTAGVQSQGTFFRDNNSGIGFIGNTVRTGGTNAGGFVLLSGNDDILVSKNTIHTMGEALFTVSNNIDFTIDRNTMSSGKAGSSGILSIGNSNVLTISNNTFTNPIAADGVYFRGNGITVLDGSDGNVFENGTIVTGGEVCGTGYTAAGSFVVDGVTYASGEEAAGC